MRYEVDVRYHGVYVASHITLAPDALTAINLIESEYGPPVRVEETAVEGEDGFEHIITVPHGWHGYSFEARRLEKRGETPLALIPALPAALMVVPPPVRV